MESLENILSSSDVDNMCMELDQQIITLRECSASVKALPDQLLDQHCISLFKAVHRFLDNRDLLDVIVNCSDGVCSAHRLVLAAFSPTLQVLLMEGSSVSSNNPLCVVLDDVKLSDFELLVGFMYTGLLDVPENVGSLFAAAQQLGMVDVVKILQCSKNDSETRTVDQATETFVSDNVLSTTSLSPVMENFTEGQNSGMIEESEKGVDAEETVKQNVSEELSQTVGHDPVDKSLKEEDCDGSSKAKSLTEAMNVFISPDVDIPFEFHNDGKKAKSSPKKDHVLSVSQNTRHREKRRPILAKSSAKRKQKNSKVKIKQSPKGKHGATTKLKESSNQKSEVKADNLENLPVKIKEEPLENNDNTRKLPKGRSKKRKITNTNENQGSDKLSKKRRRSEEDTSMTDASEKLIPSACIKSDDSAELTEKLAADDESWICQQCGFMAKSKAHLDKHVSQKHCGGKQFKCVECNKEFKLKRYLNEHMKVHTDEQPFACGICGARFRAARNLARHNRTHTGEKKHTCELCGKSFTTAASLMKHQAAHSGERPFKCLVEGCTYAGTDETLLKTHMKHRHDANRQLILCDSCGRAFKTKQSLKCHILAVHEAAVFNCPHCPYTSRFKTGITSHVKRIHGLNLNGRLAPPSFHCEECDFSCFTRHEYTRHIRNHRGEKPYQCPICPFATVEQMNLKFHMRIHTGEKPHECTICHKKFPRTMGLKRHMLTHTAEKPHKCSICDASYADKKSLETHHNVQHLHIQPFICHVCAYSTIKKETLMQHLRKVHQIETPRQKQRRLTHQNAITNVATNEISLNDHVTDIAQSLHSDAVAVETVVMDANDKQGPQVIIQEVNESIQLDTSSENQFETFTIYSMDGNSVDITPLLLQQKPELPS